MRFQGQWHAALPLADAAVPLSFRFVATASRNHCSEHNGHWSAPPPCLPNTKRAATTTVATTIMPLSDIKTRPVSTTIICQRSAPSEMLTTKCVHCQTSVGTSSGLCSSFVALRYGQAQGEQKKRFDGAPAIGERGCTDAQPVKRLQCWRLRPSAGRRHSVQEATQHRSCC